MILTEFLALVGMFAVQKTGIIHPCGSTSFSSVSGDEAIVISYTPHSMGETLVGVFQDTKRLLSML